MTKFNDFAKRPPEVTPDDVRAMEDAEPAPLTNWNPIANGMADAQGMPPGSWPWVQAGPAAFAGSSGEQASYGWLHNHKLFDHELHDPLNIYRRAVLANYGHRRSYYSGPQAQYRQFSYEAAGRPHGWEPESPGDQPDGSAVYLTSAGATRVTGPDAEHMWLTPLFALVDDRDPILVNTGLGNKLPSNLVAKWLATMLVSSAVGMVRDHRTKDGKPYPWTYGDRATGRLLHTIVEGAKRGCLPNADVDTAARFIGDIVLPFYERSPGIHSFGAPRDGRFPLGLFNGLFWIIPAVYDAQRILAKLGVTAWDDRFEALLRRWSQWMLDMHTVLPHECFRADRMFLDPRIYNQDHPPASIADFIRPEDFLQSFDFRSWAFRAVDIAAKVTGDAGLHDAVGQIADAFRNDRDKRRWLVTADGGYVA